MNENMEFDSIELNDKLVADYLQQNPTFFIRNAAQTELMRVPHPVRGSVSLVEWQLGRQRKRIEQLEEEITALMEQAAANEILFQRLLTLQNDLIQSESLQDLLARLQRWAKSMGLSDVSIRLFSERWRLNAPSNFNHLTLSRKSFEPFRIQRMADENHFLGPLTGPEILLLTPHISHVGSVALSLLGRYGDLGVVIFTSRDSKHYEPGMGTLLLDQISLLLPILINRWVERI